MQFSRGFLGRAASQSCRRGDGFWAVDDGAGDDDYAGPYAPSPSRNYGYFLGHYGPYAGHVRPVVPGRLAGGPAGANQNDPERQPNFDGGLFIGSAFG